MPSLPSAGTYKAAQNEIGGSEHTPAEPWSVTPEMAELAEWFANGSGDAVLDAAVVHAWLTHIHPFDDGNGRTPMDTGSSGTTLWWRRLRGH